jgi:hypothetical protein
MSDMQALGPFADRAAQTIEDSRRHQSVLRVVRHGVRQLAGVETASAASDDPAFRYGLELGELVLQIASPDTPLTSACAEVIRGLIEYAHARER